MVVFTQKPWPLFLGSWIRIRNTVPGLCDLLRSVPDPVLFYPLDPDPGWIFSGSGSRIRPLFWWNFLTISSESMLCYLYNTGLLLKLTHKTINSMKKLCLLLLPLFLHRTRIRDPRFGMNKYSDPGSGIKHPGSATLPRNVFCCFPYFSWEKKKPTGLVMPS
jgi:hypothetical protein